MTRSALLAPLLLLIGCDAAASQPQDRRDVVEVQDSDAAVNAAKARARAELPAFMALLRRPPAGTSGYSVKYNLTPEADAEFIWANDLRLDGATLKGRLANDPIAPGFALGQEVTIPDADIVDWGYVKDGVMQGHHTTRALLEKMPAEEAAPIRRALGWN